MSTNPKSDKPVEKPVEEPKEKTIPKTIFNGNYEFFFIKNSFSLIFQRFEIRNSFIGEDPEQQRRSPNNQDFQIDQKIQEASEISSFDQNSGIFLPRAKLHLFKRDA